MIGWRTNVYGTRHYFVADGVTMCGRDAGPLLERKGRVLRTCKHCKGSHDRGWHSANGWFIVHGGHGKHYGVALVHLLQDGVMRCRTRRKRIVRAAIARDRKCSVCLRMQ